MDLELAAGLIGGRKLLGGHTNWEGAATAQAACIALYQGGVDAVVNRAGQGVGDPPGAVGDRTLVGVGVAQARDIGGDVADSPSGHRITF